MLLESHVSVLFCSTFKLVLPLHYNYYLKESELMFSVYEDDDILLPANITMKLREDVWMLCIFLFSLLCLFLLSEYN